MEVFTAIKLYHFPSGEFAGWHRPGKKPAPTLSDAKIYGKVGYAKSAATLHYTPNEFRDRKYLAAIVAFQAVQQGDEWMVN
jgi:hypothetical protein